MSSYKATAPNLEEMNDPPPPYPGLSTGNPPVNPPVNPGYVQTTAYPLQPGFQTIPLQGTVAPASQQTVIIVSTPSFGTKPVTTICHECNRQVITSTSMTSGVLTWSLSGACILFGCWMGCCLFPFCCQETKDVKHKCPNCNITLGRYKRC